MSRLYIGVMSGTSLDGVDVALCKIGNSKCTLISTLEYPISSLLQEEILTNINGFTTLQRVGTMDNKLGNLFADAVNALLKKELIDAKEIAAIGLHGQTLWHKPAGANPFSMQLGDPNIVAVKTGIQVVSDFRRMDIANGGQGAPFTPAFHKHIFAKLEEKIAVLNIGGMANLTILDEDVKGWDSGVGNVLMDFWIKKTKRVPFDKDGTQASKGDVNKELLKTLLSDEYFQKLPPKSTGREYFNEKWLYKHLPMVQVLKDEDIQRTLLELTALSIANDVNKTNTNLLIVCGGGANNGFLMSRLKNLCNIKVSKSDEFGVSSEFMEAMAFAWLAHKRINRQTVSLSSVTGSTKDSILGGIYG